MKLIPAADPPTAMRARPLTRLLALTLVATAPAALAQPAAPEFWWIEEDRLALGAGRLGAKEGVELRSAGFGAVLGILGEDEADDRNALESLGLRYRQLVVDRPEEIDFATLVEGLRWIGAENAAGRAVYIHTKIVNRTSAFAAGYVMAREGLAYEEALDVLDARGVRVNVWDPEVLYQLEARLTGRLKLGLYLSSTVGVVSPGEVVDFAILVKDSNGSPVSAGLELHSGPRLIDTESGPEGTANFQWLVEDRDCWSKQCFLVVRASAPGYVPSVQRVILPRPEWGTLTPTTLEAAASQSHALEDGHFPIAFNLRGSAALAVPVEVIGPGLYARGTTGGGIDRVDLPVPPEAGETLNVTVRAHRFGLPPLETNVTLHVVPGETKFIGGLFPPETQPEEGSSTEGPVTGSSPGGGLTPGPVPPGPTPSTAPPTAPGGGTPATRGVAAVLAFAGAIAVALALASLLRERKK